MRLTLDGAFSVRLRGPGRAQFDLAVTAGGRTVRRTTARGSADRISVAAACRSEATETLTVTVRRRAGRGAYGLTVGYAG